MSDDCGKSVSFARKVVLPRQVSRPGLKPRRAPLTRRLRPVKDFCINLRAFGVY
jgi:hypothetical protein